MSQVHHGPELGARSYFRVKSVSATGPAPTGRDGPAINGATRRRTTGPSLAKPRGVLLGVSEVNG